MIAALEKSLFTERIIRARRALEACTKLFPGKKNIVLDEYMKPIFGNEEALEIFSNRPESLEIDCPPSIFLPEKLHEFCQKLKKSAPLEKDRISFQEFNVRTDDGREIAGHLGLLSEPQQPPMYLVCLDLPLITLSKELRRFGLSKRELEVANLVCQGLKNSQIADHLFISESTVEKHLYSIYNKCGVNKRTSLVYLLILQDRLFALDSLSPL